MKNKIKNFKAEIFIILLYLFLSICATFPVIFRLNSAIYGTATDSLAWIWEFWWLKYSYLKGLPSDFISILSSPFGLNNPHLYPVWVVFNRYLTILMGEIAAYNIQVLGSFFLSGLAMYALVFYFTKNRLASFFSGLVLMFSPYHFARSWEHLCLSNMHWMLFYIISLFNLYQKRTYGSAFICGVCFALIGQFSSYYYVYFMGIFTILFFVFNVGYAVFRKQKVRLKEIFQFVKLSIAGLTVIALIMLPQIWRHLKMVIYSSSKAQTTGIIRSFGQLFSDAARPLNYFLPTVYHPLLGKITKVFVDTPLYGENSGGEQSLYLGVIPIFLAFAGYKSWKKRRISRRSNPATDFLICFWVFALFTFMVCSFSPYWGIKNVFFIPFPSFFLFKIFPMIRNYARMGGVVMIAVCVLAGFGLNNIIKKLSSKKMKFVVVTLLCCGVLFEFLNVSPITDTQSIPEVYNWLRLQPEDTVVAEYPIEADFRPILFYQRVHQKKLINGAIPETYAYEVMQKIIGLKDSSTAGILSFLGTDYVLVHKDKYLNYEGGRVLGQVPDIENNPGFKFVRDFGNTAVYKVMSKPVNPDAVTIDKDPVISSPDQKTDLLPALNMNFNFKEGDSFEYIIKYMGLIPALHLNIKLGEGQPMDGTRTMRIEANVYPSSFFSRFFDGKAQVQSLFDINNFYNYKYEESIQVKNKIKEKTAVFDRENGLMSTKDRQVKITPYTQDPISAVFFLSSQKLWLDKRISVDLNPGKTNYQLELVVDREDEIMINEQVYKCWRLKGGIVKGKDMNKKITDDQLELVVDRQNEIMINEQVYKCLRRKEGIVKGKDMNKKIADIILWFNKTDKQELVKIEAFTKAGLISLEKQDRLYRQRDQ
ncbi:MAG: DUF3108 domain-containing protein [Candidatus Omnitrophota bacterium]